VGADGPCSRVQRGLRQRLNPDSGSGGDRPGEGVWAADQRRPVLIDLVSRPNEQGGGGRRTNTLEGAGRGRVTMLSGARARPAQEADRGRERGGGREGSAISMNYRAGGGCRVGGIGPIAGGGRVGRGVGAGIASPGGRTWVSIRPWGGAVVGCREG